MAKFAVVCKITALGICLALLSACHQFPEQVSVDPSVTLVPFYTVSSNIAATELAGEQARWAGRIWKVDKVDGYSIVEVAYYPTKDNGEPRVTGRSEGSFKAVIEGSVDQSMFKQGKLVTILGEVAAPVLVTKGEQLLLYPTINAESLYLWGYLNQPEELVFLETRNEP